MATPFWPIKFAPAQLLRGRFTIETGWFSSPTATRNASKLKRGRMVERRYISTMALNIKNPQVEELAAEVAQMAAETKTEAIRRALIERKQRLQARGGGLQPKRSIVEYLEQH